MRAKVGKSWNTVFANDFCGSRGSKSRLAKAAGAEQSGQMRDEKWHAVVAQSTFASEKAKNTKFGALFAELFRFWRYRSLARIAPFLTLSSSKTEEVSQNSFVIKLADRQIDRQLQLQLTLHYTTLHYTTRIALHYIPLHYTTLNYITLHYSYTYNYITTH